MLKVDASTDLKAFEDMLTAKVNVVDFSAEWCGPCRQLHPELNKLASTYTGKPVKFLNVDVDQSAELAEAYQISAMPTVVMIQGGTKKILGTTIGLNMEKIKQDLEKYVEESNKE